MAMSDGACGATTEKQKPTGESSTSPRRRLASVVQYIRREDLPSFEAVGWQAISHYAMRSDDIESILIGRDFFDA